MTSTEPRLRAATTVLLLLLAALTLSCSRGPETGPGEVRWDRQTCARCSMVVSERHHVAQVRGGPTEGPRRLFHFDDFGCAIIWLDGQAWSAAPDLEIWVASQEDGSWLDARTAVYELGVRSPMDYGLGARSSAGEGRLDFDQAGAHVRRVDQEQRTRRPGGNDDAVGAQ